MCLSVINWLVPKVISGSYLAAFLCHSLIPKTIHKLPSARRHKPPTSSMATPRMEITCGPTHSMVRAIGATGWQKCFICRCHYLHCNSEVAGLLSFDDFLVCLVCKTKVQPADDKFGTCTSYTTLQKVNHCKRQVRAKLLLTRPGGSYITLNVFGDHLKQICCQESVSEERLLQASPFSFTYNNQIINSISWEHSQ